MTLEDKNLLIQLSQLGIQKLAQDASRALDAVTVDAEPEAPAEPQEDVTHDEA